MTPRVKPATKLDAALEIIKLLEFRYDVVGMKEGEMCPACYQFRLRKFPKYTRAWAKRNYGHKPECWLAKRIKEMEALP